MLHSPDTERHTGRSARFKCNFLPFLSGSGEKARQQVAAVRISLAECGSEQPEFVARQTAASESAPQKNRGKIPLLKVLEILKNFFQEVFKQGSGQSPEVLGFGTESQGLMA